MPSEPTLRKLIRDDAEFGGIIKRGSNGDAYEIDLPAAVEYWRGLEARKAEALRARQAQLAQFGLDLGLAIEPERAELTSAERQAMLQEDLLAMKVGRERGALVAKASVEAAVGQFLVMLREQGSSFAARLAKRADVPRALQIEIERLVASDQVTIARRLRALAEVEDGDGIEPASSALDAIAA